MTDGAATEPVVDARGLVKRFGVRLAADGIDLRMARGETVALFGPNGAGKTTLIRLLTLALRPDAGTLRVAGLDPRRNDREIRERIGVVSHPTFLYDDLTVRQNVEFFGSLYGASGLRRRADELFERLELTGRADDPVRGLSRGLRQRAALARALVHDPPLLFLDEPYTGLDPHAAGLLSEWLRRVKGTGRTVLLVTHDLNRGLDVADRWLVLDRGRIVAEGDSRTTDRACFEADYLERVAGAGGRRRPP